jgi:hypothetical protein
MGKSREDYLKVAKNYLFVTNPFHSLPVTQKQCEKLREHLHLAVKKPDVDYRVTYRLEKSSSHIATRLLILVL